MKSSSGSELLIHLWLDHPGLFQLFLDCCGLLNIHLAPLVNFFYASLSSKHLNKIMQCTGQPTTTAKEEGKKKKKSGGKTVSSVYLVSLISLMETLHNCEPHFVRCLVPNTHKKPGEVEPPLIMHQLTCNGVLEGIRICMRGFPNRMPYPDFKLRYQILGQTEINSSSDNKTAVYALMDKVEFGRERYRLGHTLVFFRAGSLAFLEELRDTLVLRMLRNLQGEIYKRLRFRAYEKKRDQRELIRVGQRQFRKYQALRDWGWFVIIHKTRALIGVPNPEAELEELNQRAKATYGVYKEKLELKEKLLQENKLLEEETHALLGQIDKEQGNVSHYREKQEKLSNEKTDLEAALTAAQNKLARTEQQRIKATNDKKKQEQEISVVKKDIADIELVIRKLEQEKTNKDHIIGTLNDEISNQDATINKLNKEKKLIAENSAKSSDDLQQVSDKVDHLLKVKLKLESTLDELEGSLDKEKKARVNIDKERRKVEGELRITQEQVADLERSKKELEAAITRKESEITGLGGKLEDEQSLVSKVQKGIKESQARVEEMEEELEAERQARAKAERQRSDLVREMESLGDRFTHLIISHQSLFVSN